MLNWIRLTDKKLIAFVPGRIIPSDRAMIRKDDGNRGAYDFRFENGRTRITLTEHPEWVRAWRV